MANIVMLFVFVTTLISFIIINSLQNNATPGITSIPAALIGIIISGILVKMFYRKRKANTVKEHRLDGEIE